jgi:hypothetical protein
MSNSNGIGGTVVWRSFMSTRTGMVQATIRRTRSPRCLIRSSPRTKPSPWPWGTGVALYDLAINRMSPSAYTRDHEGAIFYILQYLSCLKEIGANVLHGYDTCLNEFSKARQMGIFHRLGAQVPARTRHQPRVPGPQGRCRLHISGDPKAEYRWERRQDCPLRELGGVAEG